VISVEPEKSSDLSEEQLQKLEDFFANRGVAVTSALIAPSSTIKLPDCSKHQRLFMRRVRRFV
jgi:hypothetical protein